MEKSDFYNPKVVLALFMVHFVGDFYSSFVTPLLPVLAAKHSLSLTQVGFMTALMRLLAFVVQPSVGYLADRHQTRIFVLGGPALCLLFIPLMGVAQSFAVLLIFLSLGSIGQAMFHPPTASMISTYGGNRVGFSMSIFGLGGTIAFGLGPLVAAGWVSNFSLETLPYLILPGLFFMVYLFVSVPNPKNEDLGHLGFWGSLKETLGPAWKTLLVIWLLVLLRTFVGQSFLTFLPLYYADQGRSLISIGVIIAIWTVAGAVSGVAAGYLCDKIGYKPVFLISYILSTPLLFLLLYLPGQWVFLNSFLAGFMILATMFPAIALAQRLAPKGKSMVSSLMMGFAFGVGGMLTPVTGWLAEKFSINTVLYGVALVPLLVIFLIVILPEPSREGA